jgi:hypothetical protein
MVREICMTLPFATERLSHGTPSWYVQDKRQFVMFWNNHHNDGRLGLWMAAPMGSQQALIAESPAWFFVPPYVAHRGWIGVLLVKGLSHNELTDLIADAYRAVAPPKFAAMVDAGERDEP